MVITSFSPETATNTGEVTITLYGTGFQSEQISNILLDQSVTKRYTCSKMVVRSDTELAVTFSLISAEPGPYSIVIKTTKTANYQSQSHFHVYYASSPYVDGISPGMGHLGEGPFACVIKGTGFMPGCTVEMESRGGEIFPASVSSVLWNSIHSSFTGRLDVGDRYLVRVRNIDTQISQEEVYFVVYGPPPMVTGINPAMGNFGDDGCEITLTGSGFSDGCRIHLRDSVSGVSITNLSSTVVSDGGDMVTGVFDLSGVSAGLYGVFVENADGQESVDEITFTVTLPIPVVSYVVPSTGLIGDSSFSLSVSGSGFTDGCHIHLRDSMSGMTITNLSPTVVSDGGQKVTGVFDLTGVAVGLYGVFVENADGQESVDEIIFTVNLPVPVVCSVDPSSSLIGDSSLSISVTGTGFTDGCHIHLRDSMSSVSITNLSPTVVSDGGQKVTGVFDLTGVSAGLYGVFVENPDGQESVDEITFTVTPPAPVVSSVVPSTGLICDSSFSLSVSGSGFTDGCNIHLRDSLSGVSITNLSSTVVSDGGQKVTGVFDLTGASAGLYGVFVENPDGQESVDEITFMVNLPVPVVSSVDPSAGFTGDSSLSISVTGTGFTDGCNIHLRDSLSGVSISNMSSTVVSDGGQKVTGVFDLTGVAVGLYGVFVENADGQESVDEIIFAVQLPAPVIDSVNPSTGLTGDPSLSLSITGFGFSDGCRIHLRDSVSGVLITNMSSTVVSDNGQTVTGVFDLSGVTAGSYGVSVENPVNQESVDEIIFTVQLPAPIVSSVDPSAGLTCDTSFSLSVSGTGFTDGCRIHLRDSVNGVSITNLSPTVVSDGGQTVMGVFDLTGSAGSYGIYVENPDGQESIDEITFTVGFPVPVVSSVDPSVGLTGDSSFSLSVSGSGFMEGCCIQMVDTLQPIKYSNISPTITSKDGTIVQGSIDLSRVPVGSYSVQIENPDKQISNENVIFQVNAHTEPRYDIHITAGQGGSTIPNGIIYAPGHSDLNIDIIPDSEYRIQDVYLDMKNQGSINSLYLTDINANHSIFADFSKNDPIPSPAPTFIPTMPPTPVPTIEPVLYLLNISAEYGGIIQPNGTIAVLKGSDVAFQIESLNDFNSSNLLVDNEKVCVNKSWTLQSVQSNHTIRLISSRIISPYWADFNMSQVIENSTHLVMFTSNYYPDCLWEVWNYGDGSVTYGRPMNHSYTQPGTYLVDHEVVFRNSTSKCHRDLIIQ